MSNDPKETANVMALFTPESQLTPTTVESHLNIPTFILKPTCFQWRNSRGL